MLRADIHRDQSSAPAENLCHVLGWTANTQIDARTASLGNWPRQSLSLRLQRTAGNPTVSCPTRLCNKQYPPLALRNRKTCSGERGHQLARSHLMLVEALVVLPHVPQRLAGPCNGQNPEIRHDHRFRLPLCQLPPAMQEVYWALQSFSEESL